MGLVGDAATGDNIHVGIRGDFGDVRIGEVPDATGFGQVAGDVGGAQISSDIDGEDFGISYTCLLYTSPSPRDRQKSRMPSSA